MKSLCEGFVTLDYENRKDTRYDLEIPVQLQFSDGLNVKKWISLCTKNISSSGAFFMAEVICPVGAHIKAVLMLPEIKVNKSNTKTRITVNGIVIRNEDGGFAVCFDSVSEPTWHKLGAVEKHS